MKSVFGATAPKKISNVNKWHACLGSDTPHLMEFWGKFWGGSEAVLRRFRGLETENPSLVVDLRLQLFLVRRVSQTVLGFTIRLGSLIIERAASVVHVSSPTSSVWASSFGRKVAKKSQRKEVPNLWLRGMVTTSCEFNTKHDI